jgi:hypothetical protein
MSNINPERNDYVTGRRDQQIQQEDNSSLQGLLLGLLLFLGLGGIAASLFFFNRTQTPVTPVIVPSTTVTSPPVENRETIIREKSTEFVPVPVSPAAQPDINITVPSPQPSASAPSQPSTQPSASPSVPSNEASSPSPVSEPATPTNP